MILSDIKYHSNDINMTNNGRAWSKLNDFRHLPKYSLFYLQSGTIIKYLNVHRSGIKDKCKVIGIVKLI